MGDDSIVYRQVLISIVVPRIILNADRTVYNPRQQMRAGRSTEKQFFTALFPKERATAGRVI